MELISNRSSQRSERRIVSFKLPPAVYLPLRFALRICTTREIGMLLRIFTKTTQYSAHSSAPHMKQSAERHTVLNHFRSHQSLFHPL